MAFYVGQKVVCVDDGSSWGWNLLTKGVVYTVAATLPPTYGRVGPNRWATLAGVRLVEVLMPGPNDWFRAGKFRPAVERKTDISIFTKMLTPNKRELVG